MVQGESRPAGSKTAMPIWCKKTGDYLRKDGRIVTRAMHPKTKTKESVRDYMNRAAAAARETYGDGPLLEGPLRLVAVFYRPRPRGHFGTGRNIGKLKASAPPYPTTTPDTLKLCRAVEDALKKVIWRDDSQVCDHSIRKMYGSHYYAEVEISTLDEVGELQREVEAMLI